MPARRAGLLAKKISVQGKLGKRHMRTYWVRPEEAQLNRLRRARKEGEFSEGYVPQTVHPHAGVKAFFKGRGKVLSDEEASNLINLFKKPDGSLPTDKDFEALFANPGVKALPLKKKNGKKAPWGLADAVEELNPDGTQKIQHLKIRLDVASLRIDSPDNMSISIAVMGTPIHPPWHPQAGQPTGKPDVSLNSEGSGMNRSYTREADGVHVSHGLFVLAAEYQGTSVGAEVISNQFKQYEKLGVSSVGVHGEWIGRYFWGSIGFEANASNKSQLTEGFKSAITALQNGTGKIRNCDQDQPKTEAEGRYKLREKLIKPNGVPYTVNEIMAMHSFSGATTAKVFRTEVPVLDSATGGVRKVQIFKDFMLNENLSTGFWGDIKVKPGDPSYEAVRAKFGMRPRLNTPEGAAFDAAEVVRLAKQAAERPQRLADSLALMPAHEREAARRAAEAAEVARVEAEARAIREAAAERVRVEMAAIREPILNPVGQPSDAELRALTNRVDGTTWNPAQNVLVADRAAWIANNAGPGTRATRESAMNAMTGQLDAQRANGLRELARRYRMIGEESEANSLDRQANDFASAGRERAVQDVGRGNTDAALAFDQAMIRGQAERAAAEVNVPELVRTHRARAAAIETERVAREATETAARVAATETARVARVAAEDAERAARATAEAATAARAATRTANASIRTAAQAAIGEPPPARPVGTNNIGAMNRAQLSMRLMTPEQRASYIANSSDREIRTQALDEMTGVASQRRADYADREATHYAATGDNRRAAAARRTRDAQGQEATRLATEFAAREAANAPIRAEMAADQARAQAVLPATRARSEAATAAHQSAVGLYRSMYLLPDSSPAKMAARAEVLRLRTESEAANTEHRRIAGLARAAHAMEPEYNSEEDRQEARVALAGKESRVAARAAERAAVESAFRVSLKVDKPRALAVLAEQTAKEDRLHQRAAETLDALNASSHLSGTPERNALIQKMNEARVEFEEAAATGSLLSRLSRGQFTPEETGHVEQARSLLAAKEGRIETRRVETEARAREEARQAKERAAQAAREAAEKAARVEAERARIEKEAAKVVKAEARAREEESVARVAAARKAAKAEEARVAAEASAAQAAAATTPMAPVAPQSVAQRYAQRGGAVGRRSSLRVRL